MIINAAVKREEAKTFYDKKFRLLCKIMDAEIILHEGNSNTSTES